MQKWRTLVIDGQMAIGDAMEKLNQTGYGALLVCDAQGKLEGLLTDGDFRRAVLRRIDLDHPCHTIMTTNPITATPDISAADALHVMDNAASFLLMQLPLVDEAGKLQGLLTRADVASKDTLPDVHAVVMAGGFGKRLMPLTNDTPKPMLPVQGRPLLEHIVGRLKKAGVEEMTFTTHYLPEKIHNHFGDGRKFDVNISYVHEDSPLGTAGALSLLDMDEGDDKPLLVMNGDILSDVNLKEMIRHHVSTNASITVATRQYDIQVPYGVLNVNEQGQITDLVEKPVHTFQISAGIYILQPKLVRDLPRQQVMQMPDVIEKAIQDGLRVESFVLHEQWLDIGRSSDYERAQNLSTAI